MLGQRYVLYHTPSSTASQERSFINSRKSNSITHISTQILPWQLSAACPCTSSGDLPKCLSCLLFLLKWAQVRSLKNMVLQSPSPAPAPSQIASTAHKGEGPCSISYPSANPLHYTPQSTKVCCRSSSGVGFLINPLTTPQA